MKTNLILLLFFVSISSFGQFGIPTQVDIDVSFDLPEIFGPVRNGAAGDIDGDGIPDAILAPPLEQEYLLLRKGISIPPFLSFEADTLFDFSYNPILQDFDLDGDLDLLLTAFKRNPEDTGVLAIAWNDGNGNFSALDPLPNEGEAGARITTSIDIDQDGDEDILYSVLESASADFPNGIVWLENDGTGAFEAHILGTFGAYAIDGGDIDGDGDQDLLVSELFADRIVFLENIDNLDFDYWFTRNTAEYPSEIHAEDFNGDGLDDIVVSASDITYFIFYYENLGTEEPTFNSINVNSTGLASSNTLTSDFDGDDDLDIVYTSIFNGITGWFENDGAGNFSFGGYLNEIFGARLLIPFEYNADGLTDFLFTSLEFNRSGIVINEEGDDVDFFRLGVTSSTGYSELAVGSSIRGDEDSNDEILILNQSGEVYVVNINQQSTILATLSSDNYFAVNSAQAIDVENDGDDDVILNTNNGIYLFRNQEGDFVEEIIDTAIPYAKLMIYDIDEDGLDDILALSEQFSVVNAYFADGLGGFGNAVVVSDEVEEATTFTILAGTSTTPAGMLFPQNASNKLSFVPFNGGENFGSVEIVKNNPFEIRFIEKGDLNNDGLEDIVLATNKFIVALYNFGDNQFGNLSPVDLTTGIRQILLEDFTGDGATDILALRRTSNSNKRQINLFETQGLGYFPKIQGLIGERIESLATGDFNSDGKPDLVFDVNSESNFVDDRLGVAANVSANMFIQQNDLISEETQSSGAELILYPNPVEESFRLFNTDQISGEEIDFIVFDIQGRVVLQRSGVHKSRELYVNDLEQGAYQIVISDRDKGNLFNLKFIKN